MKYLEDLWDERRAQRWENDTLELLRYRSNLLGADLRITNFGGGNTSSKYEQPDPFSGQPVRVLAVKGSGGDLGSIGTEGFSLLYLDRLQQLQTIYRGEEHEDEMVGYYPRASFGQGGPAPSIDTPLHAFLPFAHVDHLHPDWAIALAASANGKERLEEFNQRFGHGILWIPWQRPGFELALMIKRAVEETPECDGLLLGSHGLFTWGETQRCCYRNGLRIIDHFGEFVLEHQEKAGARLFGGSRFTPHSNAAAIASQILPSLRGRVSSQRRFVAHWQDSKDVQQFVNSVEAEPLARLGTSCPDHFVRTKIRPLYVKWDPAFEDVEALRKTIEDGLETYRREYREYYELFADGDSPEIRDPNPSVVLIPGLGILTFGKSKKEARITGEFYGNAIQVIAGATSLANSSASSCCPQARHPEQAKDFASFHNYVAMPLKEAFRIEYWALEEAKLKRLPPEKEFSRKIFLIVGAGSGIGRASALALAERGAHVMVADIDEEAAGETAGKIRKAISDEVAASCLINISRRLQIREALERTVLTFGGLDGVISTAARFPAEESLPDAAWRETLDINVTGNYLLADEAKKIFQDQGLPTVLILTSSANAIAPKRGSELYDISKSAVNHLIRELAVGMAPLVRVNGIAPATVIEGSNMFSRQRVLTSLRKYNIVFEEDEPLDSLREKLARFYARRTLTGSIVHPEDCAEAICWLAGDRSRRITGHVLPVDGGLPEAFLR